MSFGDALRKVGIYRVPIENGGIYRIRNKAIDFPVEDAKGTRKPEDFRTVTVMSNQELCDSPQEESVLIAPMSHDLSMKHSTDIVIRATKENGLNADGRIILSHIQPIEKKALEKKFGRFSDAEWQTVVTHVLDNIDRSHEPTSQPA
ncbi:MAG TPA: type II toxin-antitoxin system PemK/MazF family toxin [Candidatus Dormibacteraeota bacterium]|jgi:mRNA-degrading endonuclease toxin of MazEF toxin-antitoxin module|nr:type II toxin-antitoxin system PemK/MazF family toxin [Candidatus Dormibacteraeota bacterium]